VKEKGGEKGWRATQKGSSKEKQKKKIESLKSRKKVRVRKIREKKIQKKTKGPKRGGQRKLEKKRPTPEKITRRPHKKVHARANLQRKKAGGKTKDG